MVALINGNSASASEIVCGALQDMDRAVLMGQRSFGKGLVQSLMPLGYNAYAKITTAKYYIPSGRCVQRINYSAHDGSNKEIIPDSLIREFTTRNGRKVYDGKGLMPDVKVEPEYISSFAMILYNLGYIEDFLDGYMRRNPNLKVDNRSFSISDGDYEEFVKMAMERDIPYQSESRTALERLRSALAKERNDSLNEALNAIDKGLKDDKRSCLETFREEIVGQINKNIVLRHAYSKGVIINSLKDDNMLAAAKELLANKAEYERILTKQDTTRK
jgi:carboxyl-terminal processing protease